MELEEFTETLATINREITTMKGTRSAYYASWTTEENLEVLNRYLGFFHPVREAMQTSMLLTAARIVDKDPRTASVPNLIRAVRENPELLPHATDRLLVNLEEKSGETAETVEKLIVVRNKTLAHRDRSGHVPLLTKGEVDQLIEGLVNIFNDFSSAVDRSVTSWQKIDGDAERHTKLLLQDADEGFKFRQEAYAKLLEDTKQFESPSGHV